MLVGRMVRWRAEAAVYAITSFDEESSEGE